MVQRCTSHTSRTRSLLDGRGPAKERKQSFLRRPGTGREPRRPNFCNVGTIAIKSLHSFCSQEGRDLVSRFGSLQQSTPKQFHVTVL